MIYCIADLQDLKLSVRQYVDALEDVLIEASSVCGVAAEGRKPGRRGIWTAREEKIGAVGVGISRYITTHGASLNVNTSLDFYEPIVACGLPKAVHSSLQTLSERAFEISTVSEAVQKIFLCRFDGYVTETDNHLPKFSRS